MPIHYKGSVQEKLVLDAYLKLIRASESIKSRLSRLREKDGLTMTQFGLMEVIYHLGPLNQKEIAKKLLSSSGNIVMVIDNLEKQNLVIRKRNERDRRNMEIHLTEIGNETIKRIFINHLNDIKNELSVLSFSELMELSRLTKKIGKK